MIGVGLARRALLVLVMVMVSLSPMTVKALNGVVTDQQGEPIPGAIVVVVEGVSEVLKTNTNSDGSFNAEVQGTNISVYVYADLPETPGVDYIPLYTKAQPQSILQIVLMPGSSILINGNIQYVDTENIALKTTYLVRGENNVTLDPSGMPLEYDTSKWSIARVDLPERQIIVPVDSYVRLDSNSSFLVHSQVVERNFTTNLLPTAPQGRVLDIDVRKYTIPGNIRITRDAADQLDSTLDTMKRYGFYIARQEGEQSKAQTLLEQAEGSYTDDLYSDSFDSLKLSYITSTHATAELNYMFNDASLSVYIIIAFFALVSLITGYFLIDGVSRIMAVSTTIFIGSLTVFYVAYPGSKIVNPDAYAYTAIISLAAFAALGSLAPKIFSAGVPGERVKTRNLIVPIFDIAKRSLRRRKLRFLLTLTSITLLVMSFVTLTSFSEGYGIIESDYTTRTPWQGVFIREGSWTRAEPTFINYNPSEVDWLTAHTGVVQISPKAQNIPQQRSFLSIGGRPIFGVLGVGPQEDSTVGVAKIIEEGSLPDDGGVMISSSVAESLGLTLGDRVSIGLLDLKVEGFFDDTSLAELNDIDGSKYLPDKWVNVSPEGETPTWVLETCEPQETIILNVDAASKLPATGVQRVGVILQPGTDLKSFAESLSLERGYISYASTADRFYVISLGNYFEGKGFTLAIPWGIVVLNVVVTMLNSLYERRKEIEILSSIGLNPAQVSAIFVAEASVTGFIAGGLGYLTGTSFYKVMTVLNLGLQLNQKVSAVWSAASIAVAISAVLTGAFAALRSSVVITPSLQRRWRIDRTTGGFQEPWHVQVPIKLLPSEVKGYVDYMLRRLNNLRDHPISMTSSIRVTQEDDVWRLSFVYKSTQSTTGNFYTKNELIVKPQPNGEFEVGLDSIGDTDWVHLVGSLIRQFTIDYSTDKNA
jgi:ABC-type lipoprotein release transport system permease subunit